MTMRIAYYYPRAVQGDGGMTGAVQRLSRAVSDAGGDAWVVCDQGDTTSRTEGARLVPIEHRVRAGQTLPSRRELERALRGADLLVLNSAWTAHNVAAGAIARKLSIPYVLAPRGAYDPSIRHRHRLRKDAWWLAFERRLVARSRALQLAFAAERPHVEALGYRGKVMIVPNGVQIPPGVSWDGGSGGFGLWLGRFDPEHKGIDLLVRGMALLPAAERFSLRLHGPDWRGGKPRVRAMVGELGLEKWVTVGDAVYGRAKWELLSRAAGFVYPSRWEWFGNSLAEAAAVGMPLLVTPYPTADFLASRGGATMVEATPAGLARGLRILVAPETRPQGDTARQIMREHFDWSLVGRSFLEQAQPLVNN